MARHRRKLSGPLMDRMDLLVHMPRPTAEELEREVGTASAHVRAQVLDARERQARRLAGTGLTTNAELTPSLERELVRADAAAIRMLRGSYTEGRLSARGHGRILRVARTIADLDGSTRVSADHVREALGLREEQVLDGAVAA
jgi:magnesium chelatase family protein